MTANFWTTLAKYLGEYSYLIEFILSGVLIFLVKKSPKTADELEKRQLKVAANKRKKEIIKSFKRDVKTAYQLTDSDEDVTPEIANARSAVCAYASQEVKNEVSNQAK